MNKKHNLDKLFLDKLHDFEANPDRKVWDNISAMLQEKKQKKRIFPFWWIAAGIVVFFLGFYLSTDKINFDIENKNSVVRNNDENKNSIEKTTNEKRNQNIVNTTNNPTDESKSVSVSANKSAQNNNVIATYAHKKPKRDISDTRNQTETKNQKKIFVSKQNSKINLFTTKITSSEILTLKNQTQEVATSIDKNVKENNFETIKEVNVKPNNDSVAIAIVQKNTTKQLPDLNAEINKKTINKKQVENKWSVGTTVALLNFESVTNRSNINEGLNGNDKKHQNTVSYGVGVQYHLNRKFAIRSGMNSLASNLATSNVVFVQSSQSGSVFLIVDSPQNENLSTFNNIPTIAGTVNSTYMPMQTGIINESRNYLEIPVEVAYNIINRKVGVEVISGFSTLLLNSNAVSLQSSGQKYNFGKLDSAKKVNFSTNVGIGIRHKITKKIAVNVDGMLKYQLGSIKNQSNNAYILGIYSGLNYKF